MMTDGRRGGGGLDFLNGRRLRRRHPASLYLLLRLECGGMESMVYLEYGGTGAG